MPPEVMLTKLMGGMGDRLRKVVQNDGAHIGR
jgi:hypothetical protein